MAWSTKSRHERGYGTAHDKARAYLLATEPLCRTCKAKGQITPAKVADHIIPLSQGGTGEMSNYQPLCTPCSDEKTAREAAEAQGRTYRAKVTTGADGWPVER